MQYSIYGSYNNMSVTISTCNQICNSPHNHSKSKMLFTFPKSPRFPSSRHTESYKFYQKKPSHNSRSTNFGYGKKFDFTSIAPKTPSPNFYNISNQIDNGLKIKKGFGFGQGRQQMKITGLYASIYQNKNPGPQYNLPIARCTTAYSIKKKINYDGSIQKNNPGPGAYHLPQFLSQDGKNYLSNFKNIVTSIFTNKSQRFKPITNEAPGPGEYVKSKIDTSPEGKYVSSRIRNTPCYRFKNSTRTNNSKTLISPGPGQYLSPSQFGNYMNKQAYQKKNKQEKDSNQLKKIKVNKENIHTQG